MKIIPLTLFALIISILEVLAYHNYAFASIAMSRIWLVWTIYSFFYGGAYIIKTIISDLHIKRFWGIFAILFIIVISSFNLENFPALLSGETTTEHAEALLNWKNADLGYTGIVQGVFPARQFLLTSAPSILWGPSIINNRLTYLIIFIFAILLFYTGLRIYYRKKPQSLEISSLVLLSILSFPVVQQMHRLFDIPILPLSFLFMSIGLLLITISVKTELAGIAFAWSLTMLVYTYTPGLSGWILMTAATGYLVWKTLLVNKHRFLGLILFISVILSAVFGINSLFYRQDILIKITENTQVADKVFRAVETFKYLFVENYDMWDFRQPFLGHVMFMPVVLYLTGGLLGFWGKKHIAASIWVFATIAIAGISRGYSNPAPIISMYRHIVIIPVILTGAADILFQKKIIIPEKILILLLIIISGYSTFITYNLYKNWDKYLDLPTIVLRDVLAVLKKSSIDPRLPVRLNSSYQNYGAGFAKELLAYYLPRAKYDLFDNNCPTDFDLKINTFVYTDQNECIKYLRESKLFKLSKFNNRWDDRYPNIVRAVYIAKS